MKRLMIVLTLVLGMFFVMSCDKDSDNGTNPSEQADPWVGTWLSAGSNVAPILVTVFNYDSVRVEMTEQQIVKTHSHVKDGAWTTVEGTYAVTKSSSGDVHSVEFVYSAFSQAGIIQIITGTPDNLKLEVVQTVPDIGATPRTPATGFGSDAALGTLNIQNYIRE